MVCEFHRLAPLNQRCDSDDAAVAGRQTRTCPMPSRQALLHVDQAQARTARLRLCLAIGLLLVIGTRLEINIVEIDRSDLMAARRDRDHPRVSGLDQRRPEACHQPEMAHSDVPPISDRFSESPVCEIAIWMTSVNILSDWSDEEGCTSKKWTWASASPGPSRKIFIYVFHSPARHDRRIVTEPSTTEKSLAKRRNDIT